MADRKRIEQLSKERGSEDLQAALDFIMGFAGPGAIKRIAGLPGLGLRVEGKAISRPRGQAADDLGQNTDTIKQLISQRRRKLGKANINRPSGSPAGKRPPDAELEALALQKQKAKITTAKQLEERNKRIRAIQKAIKEIQKAGEDEGMF